MGELPLIDATELTREQRDGSECVSCGKRLPRPTVPVGRVATGQVLYRCPECAVVLEPADPGRARVLMNRSESDRPA
jgi:predicted RNA-binding Zn-ribbon protein involved in translation (DUF1610 family)